jgi:hypothetical protein
VTFRRRVTLLDGPAAGQPCEYYTPLPPILVVATRTGPIRWHDYRRVGTTMTYRYVTRGRNVTPPVSHSAYADAHDEPPLLQVGRG